MLAGLYPTINMTSYYTPLIFNFLAGSVAFFLAFLILKRRRNEKMTDYFGYFWLMVGFCWISNFVFGIFAALDATFAAKAAFCMVYIIYIFAILQAPFLLYYLIMSLLSSEKTAQVFWIIYLFCVSVFVFFLIKEGVAGPISSPVWGIRFYLPKDGHAVIAFKLSLVPLFLLALFDFLKRIFNWIKNKYLSNGRFLVFSLTTMAYLAGGYLEGLLNLPLWQTRFAKVTILTAILTTYLVYYLAVPKKHPAKTVYEI